MRSILRLILRRLNLLSLQVECEHTRSVSVTAPPAVRVKVTRLSDQPSSTGLLYVIPTQGGADLQDGLDVRTRAWLHREPGGTAGRQASGRKQRLAVHAGLWSSGPLG